MKQTKIRQQVEEIIKQRNLLEPSDKLIVELQSLVTFSDVAGLFYSEQNYDYISNRIIDYENRKKTTFLKKS